MPKKLHSNFDDARNELLQQGAEYVPDVDDINKGSPGAHWDGRQKSGAEWHIIKESDARVEIRW